MAGPLPAQPRVPPIATVDLPAWPLAVAEADGWIVVSLGLSGVAFVPLPPWPESPPVHVREDWPTLSATDIPGEPLALLAGRDGVLRTISSESTLSPPGLVSTWPVEGVPNAALLRDDTLILAAGGAGISLWHWPDHTEAPSLRGRYPFLEFARRVSLEHGANRLYVADSIGGRVAILDISDDQRPRLQSSYPVSSFCDSVEVGEHHLVFTDRNGGAFVARRSDNPAAPDPWVMIQQINLARPLSERTDAKRAILLLPGDAFLLCEADSGVRHWRLDEPTGRFREIAVYQTRGAAVDAIVLGTGELAVADHPHGLTLFPLATAP